MSESFWGHAEGSRSYFRDIYERCIKKPWIDSEPIQLPIHPVLLSKHIDIIPQENLQLLLHHAAESLVLQLHSRFIEDRITHNTVVESVKSPILYDFAKFYPATTWDAVKQVLSCKLETFQDRIKRIRESGWLFSRTQETNVEKFIRRLEIRFDLRCIQGKHIVGWKAIPTKTVNSQIVKRCFHFKQKSQTVSCADFFSRRPIGMEEIHHDVQELTYLLKMEVSGDFFLKSPVDPGRIRLLSERLETLLSHYLPDGKQKNA